MAGTAPEGAGPGSQSDYNAESTSRSCEVLRVAAPAPLLSTRAAEATAPGDLVSGAGEAGRAVSSQPLAIRGTGFVGSVAPGGTTTFP
jgi:hypothetical protein